MDKSAWSKMFGAEAAAQPIERPPKRGVGAVSPDVDLKKVQERADLALKLATIATQKQRDDEAINTS